MTCNFLKKFDSKDVTEFMDLVTDHPKLDMKMAEHLDIEILRVYLENYEPIFPSLFKGAIEAEDLEKVKLIDCYLEQCEYEQKENKLNIRNEAYEYLQNKLQLNDYSEQLMAISDYLGGIIKNL